MPDKTKQATSVIFCDQEDAQHIVLFDVTQFQSLWQLHGLHANARTNVQNFALRTCTDQDIPPVIAKILVGCTRCNVSVWNYGKIVVTFIYITPSMYNCK